MKRFSLRTMAVCLSVVMLASLAVGSSGSAVLAKDDDRTNTTALREAVAPARIQKHLQALQQIATANGGNRASGSPGYQASVDYVAKKLSNNGYNVTIQPFDFPFFQLNGTPVFEQLTPTARTFVFGTDFEIMDYSGSGNVTGVLVPTNDVMIPPAAQPSSSSGCESGDFAPAPAETAVALIQRGTCDFVVKAANAEAAGYDAAIIFNEGQEGRTDLILGTLGGPDVTIPVFDTTFAIGQSLYNAAQSGRTTVHLAANTVSEIRSTKNVIAERPVGRTDRTTVVGAHLDSVPEGPGINDNGSGVAQNLEIAIQMAKLGIKTTNRVRFGFWGAEEAGLWGSEHYVASLSRQELNDIELNLNFDMVGSPNFVRFVYDGDGSATAARGPQGSGAIEQTFVRYFRSQGLASEPTAFDGRSDYEAFTLAGIPAGGLFSGAEGVKTAAQAAEYGGTAGVAYDECYHEACDTIANVNNTALSQFSDAAAHATLVYAMTRSAINGTHTTASPDWEFDGSHAAR